LTLKMKEIVLKYKCIDDNGYHYKMTKDYEK
jgi:hypothetical protein